MATTPATAAVDMAMYGRSFLKYIYSNSPIDKLRRQRKADCKPKKPKPVTDEQLLAIVDELEAKIKTQGRSKVCATRSQKKPPDANRRTQPLVLSSRRTFNSNGSLRSRNR